MSHQRYTHIHDNIPYTLSYTCVRVFLYLLPAAVSRHAVWYRSAVYIIIIIQLERTRTLCVCGDNLRYAITRWPGGRQRQWRFQRGGGGGSGVSGENVTRTRPTGCCYVIIIWRQSRSFTSVCTACARCTRGNEPASR